MRLLWVLFFILGFVSLLVVSGALKSLLILSMVSFIGIPLAYLLMHVPVVTAPLGLWLMSHLALRHLPVTRKFPGVSALGVVVAVFVALPIVLNLRAQAWADAVLARDINLIGQVPRALGANLALPPGQRGSLRCSPLCQKHLARHTDAIVAVDPTKGNRDGFELSQKARSYGLSEVSSGICGYNATGNNALKLYFDLIEDLRVLARDKRLCLFRAKTPETVDIRVAHLTDADFPGRPYLVHSIQRQEILVRRQTEPERVFQSTTLTLRTLSVPLFMMRDKSYGLDIRIQFAPAYSEVQRTSPNANIKLAGPLWAIMP